MTAPSPLALALWLNAAMLLATLSVLAVPILAPLLFADLGLPIAAVGVFSGALWTAAFAGSIGAGTLIRGLGAWRAAQTALLLCAAGLACGAGGAIAGLALAALLIGLANGFETPAASQLLARGVPPAQRSFYFSLKQTGVQIGGLVGALSLPSLADATSWPAALLLLAAAAATLAALLERPRRRLGEIDARPRIAPQRFGAALAQAMRHRVLRRLALAAAAFGATQVCLNSFMVSYAVIERGATLPQAGVLLGVAQSGGLIGRLVWGWLAGRHGTALPVLRALGAAMAVAAAALGTFGTVLPAAVLLPLAFAFGLTASGWNGVFLAEVAQQVPLERVASATGAVLVVMTAGLMAAPPLFAAVGSALSLGAAFVGTAVVAAAGTMCLPHGGRR